LDGRVEHGLLQGLRLLLARLHARTHHRGVFPRVHSVGALFDLADALDIHDDDLTVRRGGVNLHCARDASGRHLDDALADFGTPLLIGCLAAGGFDELLK